MLSFLLHGAAKAKQIVSICNVFERQQVSAEVTSDHYAGSEAYWSHEQGILADVVRILRGRHADAAYGELQDMEAMGKPLYLQSERLHHSGAQ